MRLLFLIASIFCLINSFAQEQPLAFPGAEGYGKYTTGGRGGKVIKVTNLNDDGEGSLRKAIRLKQPRIILFTISGNIELKSPLDINYGDVTIAGQSAPGDGICLKNYTLNIKADNVIIRFLRFRMGDETSFEGDAISANSGNTNIIIDHCSMSWATDECASFYRNKNFTLQWCIISESLNKSIHQKGEHGYGGIWGGEKATFHHNLLANHNSRLPRLSGSSTTPNTPEELVDFRNNVIYNWMNNNTYGGEKGRYNVVNNYYKPGPATKSTKHFLNPSSPYGKFFVTGNVLQGNKKVNDNNLLGVKSTSPDSISAFSSFGTMAIKMQSAEEACDLVLKRSGASFHRDVVDQRIVEEVKSGKSAAGKNRNGIIDSQNDVGGWPPLNSHAVDPDADEDGMPDAFESKNKLNPNDSIDASQISIDKVYTNIEVYLNSLVAKVMDI